MALVDQPIVGSQRRATRPQMLAYGRKQNAAQVIAKKGQGVIVAPLSAAELAEIVDGFIFRGGYYGIAADAAFAQSLHETAAYTFGGQVAKWQHNPAGLGATNDGAAGGGWPTWAAGIDAYYVHLLAWCNDRRGDGDYRIAAVRQEAKRLGWATSWASLGGRWAVPGVGYGDAIERNWQAMLQEPGGATMQQFADTIKELTHATNSGNDNRPGDRLLGFDAFVVHETDNENNGAGAENTYQYLMGTYNNKVRPQASFHFVTDGIGGGHSYQLLPAGPNDAEACWAIGDGQDQPDDASNRTVSGEICVNQDGDYNLAVRLMAKIAAKVLRAHGKPVVKDVTVRQHGSYYSARNPAVHSGCPKHLKAADWGWTWDRFVAAVQAEYNALGGVVVKETIKEALPAVPPGFLRMGQPDSFDWQGEGVVTYRKVRYFNPFENKWYEREWSNDSGFTDWKQVA